MIINEHKSRDFRLLFYTAQIHHSVDFFIFVVLQLVFLQLIDIKTTIKLEVDLFN